MVVTCYSSTRLLSSRVLFVCWQCLSWWRYASYSLSADNVYPDGDMLRTVCLLTVSTLMAVRLVQFVCLQCLPWWRFASYKCREASWSVPPRQVHSGGWMSSARWLALDSKTVVRCNDCVINTRRGSVFWRCEHARFCVEVFYALYINLHSLIHSRATTHTRISLHHSDIHALGVTLLQPVCHRGTHSATTNHQHVCFTRHWHHLLQVLTMCCPLQT